MVNGKTPGQTNPPPPIPKTVGKMVTKEEYIDKWGSVVNAVSVVQYEGRNCKFVCLHPQSMHRGVKLPLREDNANNDEEEHCRRENVPQNYT